MNPVHTTPAQDLFAHMQWADARVWEAVLATAGADADEQVQRTLRHLHLVQRAFLGLWCAALNEPLGAKLDHEVDPEELEGAQELRDWARKYYPWADEFFAGVGTSDADRVIGIPWAKALEKHLGKPPKPVTLRETMYQVVAHSMHHRGQVNRRIRELGGEPPLTDYIAWLWLGRPEPRW